WWDAFRRPTTRDFVLAGIAVGLSDLVRPTLLLFPLLATIPLVVTFPVRSASRWWVAFTVATVVTIAPWLIRNRLVADAWIPLGTSHAVLWLGSPEYYHLVHDRGFGYFQIWDDMLERPQSDGKVHSSSTLEGDRYWTARAIRSIKSEPLLYA